MGKFLDRVLNYVETFAGPADWRCERANGCVCYSGRFLVHDHRGMIRSHVQGRIVQRQPQVAEVYLYDPPQFVLKHKHGRCMQLLTPNDRWFKLHFDKPASNFPEAYTYVEHMLTEAYNRSPKMP
ncbi:MAG: hypothetical protein ACKVRN_10195 [Pyrinomonadaceae bacterium]